MLNEYQTGIFYQIVKCDNEVRGTHFRSIPKIIYRGRKQYEDFSNLLRKELVELLISNEELQRLLERKIGRRERETEGWKERERERERERKREIALQKLSG